MNGANVEPSEQIKDASWSDDSRGKRSGFYIVNCGRAPDKVKCCSPAQKKARKSGLLQISDKYSKLLTERITISRSIITKRIHMTRLATTTRINQIINRTARVTGQLLIFVRAVTNSK